MNEPRLALAATLAATLAMVGLVLSGCAGLAPTRSAPETGAPVTVPVSIEDSATRMVTEVEVNGARLRVLVDTGSSGLRVLAGRVPAGGTVVGPAPPSEYGSGVRLAGTVVREPLRIGPVTAPAPVPVELVTATDCAPDRPRCQAADDQAPQSFGGELDGILGIGPAPANPPSPLWFLGPVGHSFTVHDDPAAPALVLSGPADGFTEEPLTPARAATDDGEPAWQARPPGCFAGPDLPDGRTCGPALWDTGTPGLARIAGADDGVAARPGSTLTLGTPDGRWSLAYPVDHTVRSSARAPSSVAGLAAFTRVDVRWDLDAGTIGFRTR